MEVLQDNEAEQLKALRINVKMTPQSPDLNIHMTRKIQTVLPWEELTAVIQEHLRDSEFISKYILTLFAIYLFEKFTLFQTF